MKRFIVITLMTTLFISSALYAQDANDPNGSTTPPPPVAGDTDPNKDDNGKKHDSKNSGSGQDSNTTVTDSGQDKKGTQQEEDNYDFGISQEYVDRISSFLGEDIAKLMGKYQKLCSIYQNCRVAALDDKKDEKVACSIEKVIATVKVEAAKNGGEFPLSDDVFASRAKNYDQPIADLNNSFSDCTGWAKEQTFARDDVKQAKTGILKDYEAQNEQLSSNGTPAYENEKMRQYVAENLDISSYCKEKVFSESNLKYIAQQGEAGALLSNDSTFIEKFSNASAREIKRPLTCVDEDKNFFENEGLELYTNFERTALEKLTSSSKKRICVGMAYSKEKGDSVICNDYLQAYPQCVSFVDPMVKSTIAFNDYEMFEKQLVNNKNERASFSSPEDCQSFMLNKFKQCVGLDYEEVNFNVTQTDSNASAQEKKMRLAQAQQKAKRKLNHETALQFGICFAFRQLSLEQAKDYKGWEKNEEVTSADGLYSCKRMTPWTQDYKACRSIVKTYNAFLVGDMGRQVAGQGWDMVRQGQIRKEASEKMMDSYTTTSTDTESSDSSTNQNSVAADQVNIGLDAQRQTYQHQKNKEMVNVGFYSAQAGTLTAMLAAYPTPNSFGAECDSGGDYIGSYCIGNDAASDDEIKEQLFPNQDVRRAMWGKVMQTATSGALAALKASQYKQMANDVEKYQDQFNNLNQNATTSSSTLEVGYCSLNPTSPGCQGQAARVSSSGAFSYGSIGTQNSGGGAIDYSNDSGDLGAFDEGDGLTASQQTAIKDLSNVIDNDAAGSFDNKFKKIGAGNFTRTPASSGGGSKGGSGGAASGSAYKGGNLASANGNKSAFNSGPKQKVSYGDASKVKYGSASGSSSQNKSSNPFSNLFGRKKGRTVASGVTNDIAPSHSGLFEKISKRYTIMQQDNRLLKRE